MKEYNGKLSKSDVSNLYSYKIIRISIFIVFVFAIYNVISYRYYPSIENRFISVTLVLGSLYSVLFLFIKSYYVDDMDKNTTVATKITLLRGFLVISGLSFFVCYSGIYVGSRTGWVVGSIFALSGLLDIIDGWVARNKNQVTALGGRMDIETDGISTLFGSIILVMNGVVSPFFILVGMSRYIYLIYFLVLYGETDPTDDGKYQWLNKILSILIFTSMSFSMLPILGVEISRMLLSTVGILFVCNFMRSLYASKPN